MMKVSKFFFLVVFLTITNAWAVDADSTSWEGSYEGDVLPDAAGFISFDYDPGPYSTVSGGLLNMNTMGTDDLVLWGGGAGGSHLGSTMTFADGASLEIRFRVNAFEEDGAGMIIRFSDTAGNWIYGELSPGDGSFYTDHGIAPIPGGLLTGFHTLRLTMDGAVLTAYLDGNQIPVGTGGYTLVDLPTANGWNLGDGSGTPDANWDIDYIRWTDAAAFVPPLPVATADSTTWEGSYEADLLPDAAGFISFDTDPGPYSTVSGGLLNLDTMGTDGNVLWGGGVGGSHLGSTMTFSDGASLEIRFRVNAVEEDGGAMLIRFSDTAGNWIYGELSPGDNSFYTDHGIAPIPGGLLTGFHTLRLTMDGAVLTAYLDDNQIPVGTGGYTLVDLPTANGWNLGDGGGTPDANWDIDHIRWTDQGAFVPPIPPLPPATADSTTWEGHYEADDFPDVESGITYDGGDTGTVSGGLLNLTTTAADYLLWGVVANSLTPTLSFGDPNAPGSSMEFRFRVNSVDGDGGAMLFRVSDIFGNMVFGEISPGDGSFYTSANGGLGPIPGGVVGSGFHTVRMTMSGTVINVYVDDNPVSGTGSITLTGDNNVILFGDGAGAAGADWDIDFIRWTDQGTFVPPPPPGDCGDLSNPYPVGDFTQDCVVDVNDLVILTSEWIADLSIPEPDPGMRDSANWTGSYEGDGFPHADPNWVEGEQIFNFAFPSGGSLRLDSFNSGFVGFYDLIDQNFDFNTGVSIEFRARMDVWEGAASAHLQLFDLFSRGFGIDLTDSGISIGEIANYSMVTTDDYHVYRITVNYGDNQVRLYAPDDPNNSLTPNEPVVEGTLSTDTSVYSDLLRFGDLTGADDADWRIDYIRWTNEGAFPLPGTLPLCGDPANPIPLADLDFDCFVNFGDFSIFGLHWMEDNRP